MVAQEVVRLVVVLEEVQVEGQEEEIEVEQLEVVREEERLEEALLEVVQEVELNHDYHIQVHDTANICLVLKISLSVRVVSDEQLLVRSFISIVEIKREMMS